MEFLGKNAKVVPDDVGLSVHIIMDRASVSSPHYTGPIQFTGTDFDCVNK